MRGAAWWTCVLVKRSKVCKSQIDRTSDLTNNQKYVRFMNKIYCWTSSIFQIHCAVRREQKWGELLGGRACRCWGQKIKSGSTSYGNFFLQEVIAHTKQSTAFAILLIRCIRMMGTAKLKIIRIEHPSLELLLDGTTSIKFIRLMEPIAKVEKRGWNKPLISRDFGEPNSLV